MSGVFSGICLMACVIIPISTGREMNMEYQSELNSSSAAYGDTAFGDINGDGKINSIDASLILAYSVELSIEGRLPLSYNGAKI